jgi:hypothetical protein
MRAHKARHYNKDGTLKTAEEIETQVKIIKEQREKHSDTILKADSKKCRSKRRKNVVTCHKCEFQYVSAVELDAHVCEQSDRTNFEVTSTATKVSSSASKLRKPRAKKLFVRETCGHQLSDVAVYDSHTSNCQAVSENSFKSDAEEEKTNNHNQQSEYQYKCHKCFKDFVTEQRFKAHRCLSNYRTVLKTSERLKSIN